MSKKMMMMMMMMNMLLHEFAVVVADKFKYISRRPSSL